MLMNSINDYQPRPGRVVEWGVSQAALDAAAEAPEHPAPLSFTQENHIRRCLANQEAGIVHSPWVSVVFELPGAVDTEAMAAALHSWVTRHETLLTWFHRAEDGELRRHRVPADAVELVTSVVGDLTTGAEIRDHLYQRFATSTSPLGWPAFVMGAIIRDDSTTFYYGVDHVHTDGYSLLRVYEEIRRLYEAEVTGVPAELPEPGSHLEYSAVERARAAELTVESPAIERWLDFWRAGDGTSPVFPLDLGVTPEREYPKLELEIQLCDEVEADAFADVCKASGGRFASGVFAALGIAAYELGGHDLYRTLTVLQTRDLRRWRATQGWFINLAPLYFPVSGHDGFRDLVGTAQDAFSATRELADAPAVRVLELLGLGVRGLLGNPRAVPPMVSFIDTRRIGGAREREKARFEMLAGPGSGFDAPIWVNRMWEQTYLKTTYPDTPVARVNVRRYLERVREIVATVVRTGDYPIGRDAVAPPALDASRG
ncbi:condensation domain-containing protein [Marinactinospora rubrisoli]|uniref:Condensation domain-containing protein n=1 Tax=Marinactinospora rubrisoli TaxID=2715399 RepID=A0ABW2KKW9_9ACTN